MSATPTAAAESSYDVVVVGAGFAGMYMLHRLRGQGMTARVHLPPTHVSQHEGRFPVAYARLRQGMSVARLGRVSLHRHASDRPSFHRSTRDHRRSEDVYPVTAAEYAFSCNASYGL